MLSPCVSWRAICQKGYLTSLIVILEVKKIVCETSHFFNMYVSVVNSSYQLNLNYQAVNKD